jgi:uncharacterized paraquat-inducible protein A
VYSLHKNGEKNEELVARYIAAVEAVEKEIEAVEQDIQAEETEPQDGDVKVVCCPGCGAEVEQGAMFCSRCGQKLS